MTEQAASTNAFNWGSRALGAAFLVVFMVATIGGMVDPRPGPDTPTLMPGILVVVLELILLVRVVRLGVTITPDRVISRGWLLTRSYPRRAISGAGATGYSGGYNRYSKSKAFTMLWIRVDARAVELPQVAGEPRKVHQLADQLRTALQLPTTSRARRSSGPLLTVRGTESDCTVLQCSPDATK